MYRSVNFLVISISILSCTIKEPMKQSLSAAEIFGNPQFRAISYGGFRGASLEQCPTVEELKEDMLVLNAMGIKLIRTYKTQKTEHAKRLLQAIRELKKEAPDFEMYAMLGVWIECSGAFTDNPDHTMEDEVENTAEINEAIRLTNEYPDIVKTIAVGNEAMVHWATSYFVGPEVILKWVNYLIHRRIDGKLPKDLWITSSDNFASWGGGEDSYHKPALEKLAKTVDFISMHTYPFHDTHYNPTFWVLEGEEADLDSIAAVDQLMLQAKEYAVTQYNGVKEYLESIGVDKPIHIGETGWSSITNELYGNEGSLAADEYKQKLFHDAMRAWTDEAGMSCFFFEAFDEPWKGSSNQLDSEKHFGLIDINSQAKYVLWDLVDQGVFDGITRNGQPITKTFDGNVDKLMKTVLIPKSFELNQD